MAAPPPPGQLQTALRKLSEQHWLHPNTGLSIRFGVSTIERWFYIAKSTPDPMNTLSRQRREDAGRARVFSPAVVVQIHALYRDHSDDDTQVNLWTQETHRGWRATPPTAIALTAGAHTDLVMLCQHRVADPSWFASVTGRMKRCTAMRAALCAHLLCCLHVQQIQAMKEAGINDKVTAQLSCLTFFLGRKTGDIPLE